MYLAGEMVAIKTLSSTGFHSIAEVEQVQEEMHVLAQLKHPNIIHLYDSMQSADHSWLLVMEYASGGTLTDYLAKQVCCPDHCATGALLGAQHRNAIMQPICSLLMEAHPVPTLSELDLYSHCLYAAPQYASSKQAL